MSKYGAEGLLSVYSEFHKSPSPFPQDDVDKYTFSSEIRISSNICSRKNLKWLILCCAKKTKKKNVLHKSGKNHLLEVFHKDAIPKNMQ